MRDPHVHDPAGPGEYCTGCFDQGAAWAKHEERARIEQIIEGRKKPHPCAWNEWMDELLDAIRDEADRA